MNRKYFYQGNTMPTYYRYSSCSIQTNRYIS